VFLFVHEVVGHNIPDRHDQISDADRWVHTWNRTKIQIDFRLRKDCLANWRHWCLHSWPWAHFDSVCHLGLIPNYIDSFPIKIPVCKRCDFPRFRGGHACFRQALMQLVCCAS
jgi:hypothetical protein